MAIEPGAAPRKRETDARAERGQRSVSQNLRSAAIGGLAATFVVAVSFAPRLVANREEVTVRNSSSQAAGLDATSTAVGEESTDQEEGTTTSTPSKDVSHTSKPVASPVTTVTTTPTTNSTVPNPTSSTTVPPAPPVLTNLTVRPQYSYSSWNYSDAVSLSWSAAGPAPVDGVRITYGDTTIKVAPTTATYMISGLTPERDYTFTVAAYNAAGEGPALSVSTRTFRDTAPVLSDIVKVGPGSFRVTAPTLHSFFVQLAVPNIDSVEHPPIPGCSAYTKAGENEAQCTISNLEPGHWKVHSVRIVDRTGRSTTYFGDGRLVEYGLAAMEATSVAGPYQKSAVDFTPLEFDV
jgi:hypothetical protein